MALDHSVTHSLTHSILINLLNTLSYLPFLVLLLFQVAFTDMFICHILEAASNIRPTIFPNTS